MAISTKCQTPGAQFHTRISNGRIEIAVDLPSNLALDEEAAIQLETNMHNAVELVLAPLWVTA